MNDRNDGALIKELARQVVEREFLAAIGSTRKGAEERLISAWLDTCDALGIREGEAQDCQDIFFGEVATFAAWNIEQRRKFLAILSRKPGRKP